MGSLYNSCRETLLGEEVDHLLAAVALHNDVSVGVHRASHAAVPLDVARQQRHGLVVENQPQKHGHALAGAAFFLQTHVDAALALLLERAHRLGGHFGSRLGGHLETEGASELFFPVLHSS